jgi:hypothetical protein
VLAYPKAKVQLLVSAGDDTEGLSKTAIACRFASFLVWEERSIIFSDIQPASDVIVVSLAWPSATRLTNVWRKSCQRQETPEAFLAAVHAVFQLPIAISGSTE